MISYVRRRCGDVQCRANRRSNRRSLKQTRGSGFGTLLVVKVEKGCRIRVKVDLSVVGGEQLEKSVVEYIHGGGTMLPGLEAVLAHRAVEDAAAVLAGLEPGGKRNGVIKSKDAFGNPAMHPTKNMKRSEFPTDIKLKAGERFTAKGINGGLDVVLQLEKISGDDVVVKLVHPLADKDLKYDIEVVSVSDPRPPPMPAAALKLDDA